MINSGVIVDSSRVVDQPDGTTVWEYTVTDDDVGNNLYFVDIGETGGSYNYIRGMKGFTNIIKDPCAGWEPSNS